MGQSRFHLIVIGAIAFTQAGCGTLHNLDAPGTVDVEKAASPRTSIVDPSFGTCVPLGGFYRSGLLGTFGTMGGVVEVLRGDLALVQGNGAEGLRSIGNGLWLTSVGIVALADTPVSFASDIITLPIAHARQKEQPWASWETRNLAGWFRAPFSAEFGDNQKGQREDSPVK